MTPDRIMQAQDLGLQALCYLMPHHFLYHIHLTSTGGYSVRPDVLTRVDSQLYRVHTVTAESQEVRRSRLML